MLFESKHVRIEADDRIATLVLDFAGQRSNGFNLETLDDLERALNQIHRMPWIDLLIVRSAKPAGFSPGHQLEQLAALRSNEERAAYSGRGQQVFQLFSKLPKGTCSIAFIEGVCDSAGLELALACHYRVAVLRPEVSFAFPEIRLGSIPCWGGTQRLPQQVGIRAASKMFLEGRRLSAGRAHRLGLLDRVFVARQARIELRTFLDVLQDSPAQRMNRTDSRPWSVRLHDALPGLREFPLRDAHEKGRGNGWDRLSASGELLRAVRAGVRRQGDGLMRERHAFARLGGLAEYRRSLEQRQRSAQPIRIYPHPRNPIPPLPQRIGIVGGGDLGSALALRFLLLGHEVVLKELDTVRLEKAQRTIDDGLREAIRQGRLAPSDRQLVQKSLHATTSWQGFHELGIAIEAVDEDLGIKRMVFEELERCVRPRTILVTTSTTLRVEAIQAELQRPCRVAGLHFLDLASFSPLVELVRAGGTDSDTLSALDSWARQWKFTPVLVGDHPGRLIRRVQMAYWSEALSLISEGLPPESIDREIRRFGIERGPLETLDAIGFDRLAELTRNMQLARGDRFASNLGLERMRSFGFDGCASGEGFYRYRNGRTAPNQLARMAMWRDPEEDVGGRYVFDPEHTLQEGVRRLVLRTINEAARSLGEEADADPAIIDLALSWGGNWDSQIGGPLRYADELGLDTVVDELHRLAEQCGKRFEPCLELQRRSEAGESFYGASREPTISMPTLARKAG